MKNLPLVNRIILNNSSNKVINIGDLVDVSVDHIYIQDGNSPTICNIFRNHNLNGNDIFNNKKITFFFDHSVMPANIDIANRIKDADKFIDSLDVNKFGLGAGISHIIAIENNIFNPKEIVIGSDSHTCVGGAIQCLSLGMGASDVVASMIKGTTWLRVPDTVWIKIYGNYNKFIRAKDISLEILRKYGQDIFLYKSIEFIGDWVESLSIDERCSLSSMGVELGAKCVFLTKSKYCKNDNIEKLHCLDNSKLIEINIDNVIPNISLPNSPSNVKSIEEIGDIFLDYIFIGSCTNGRLDDIMDFTNIIRNRTIHKNIYCVITPGSRNIYKQLIDLGYISVLIDSGVVVTPPGCGVCVGTQGPIPADGDNILSTMNRNFKGRMGNGNADIYLSSPIVAAVAAIIGRIPNLKDLIEYV